MFKFSQGARPWPCGPMEQARGFVFNSFYSALGERLGTPTGDLKF